MVSLLCNISSGGGGDSLWTATATGLHPTINATTLVIDSGNVALKAENANAYNTDPIIFQGKLGNTPIFNLYGDGSAYFGGQTIAHFGPPRTEFGILSPLVAYLNTDTDPSGNTGVQTYLVLHNTAVDVIHDFAIQQTGAAYNRLQSAGANGYVGQANINVFFDDSASIDLHSGGGGQGGAYQWYIGGFATTPWLKMEGGATLGSLSTLVQLEPSGTFGTPFLFKTAGAIGSGDVFTVTNNATLGFGVNFQGKIRTAQPSANGAGAWRLGKKITAAVTAVTTDYIEVEIDGVVYKLGLVT